MNMLRSVNYLEKIKKKKTIELGENIKNSDLKKEVQEARSYRIKDEIASLETAIFVLNWLGYRAVDEIEDLDKRDLGYLEGLNE